MIYGITAVFIINYMIGCSNSNDLSSTASNHLPSTKSTSSNKIRMEIKFSCGEDGIQKYLDDGWVIIKEDSEKICT